MVDGPSGWHFVTLPEDVSDEIEDVAGATSAGFGSVRVEVTVGARHAAGDLPRLGIDPDRRTVLDAGRPEGIGRRCQLDARA